MKKLYSLVIAFLMLASVSSELARAQYTMASYIVHKVDAPDPQGLGSGPNWHSVPGTAPALQGTIIGYDYYCSTPIQMPFNFRYVNTQLTTANAFVIGSAGTICLGPSLPSGQAGMYGAGYFSEFEGYFYGLNSGSNYSPFEYDYGMANNFGYDEQLVPFSGLAYTYSTSESVVPSISYAILGSAPNRELVVESDNMHTYINYAYPTGITGSYQCVIYESGISHIQFNYGPTLGSGNFYALGGSLPVTVNGWTFPGSWSYSYAYNYGSYGFYFAEQSVCCLKNTGTNQNVVLDWNGNGWNAANPFIYDYNHAFLGDNSKYAGSYTHNVTSGTWVGSPAYNKLASGNSLNTSNNTYTENNPFPFLPDTARILPQSSIGFFIAFPYDFTAGTITIPLSEQAYSLNAAFTPTATITNSGSLVPTSLQVNFTIWEVNVGQVYNQTITVPAAQLPAAFASKTITFPTYTPGVTSLLPAGNGTGGYGIYEDTMIVFNLLPTPDQNPSDNTSTDEWICSPANDIKTVSILNPPTGGTAGRSPIAVASPMAARFRNLGTVNQGASNPNGQTAPVGVTMVVKDPNGNVEYRDTIYIPNWPAGSFGGNSDGNQDYSSAGQGPGKGPYYDTAFPQWTPPELGVHTVCAIAILTTDQLRGDDTICGSSFVLPTDDAASVGIVNPQPDQEEPYGFSWQPAALFQSVGVADLFDVPVEVKIFRCSDGVMVFKADTSMPELNIDQGQVRLNFPAAQSPWNTANLAPGCYTICAYANLRADGNPANDTACSMFSVIPRLSGNIYVGVGQRFQSIHAAVDSMKYRGIGGNLNLILTDSAYGSPYSQPLNPENGTFTTGLSHASSLNGDLDFTGIAGLSDSNIVTWEPYPGQSPHIYFTGSRPSCMYFGNLFGGFMRFEGYNPLGVPIPDKVVAEPNKRGITITDMRTTSGPVFDIEQGASNITMKDLVVHGNGFYASDTSAVIRLLNQANFTLYLQQVHDTVPINNIVVNNCELGNAKFGIRDDGLHDEFNINQVKFIVWRNNSNMFTRNTIGTPSYPLSFAGIEFNNEQDLTISHNEVSNINTTLAGVTGTSWNAFGILQPSPAQYQAGTLNNPIVPGDTGNVVRCWIDANRVKNISALQGAAYGIAIQQAVTIYYQGNPPYTANTTSALPVTTQNRITNNMVLDLFSKTASYPIVMNTAGVLYSTDKDSIFNNSITTTNAATNITVQNTQHVFVWNNIIQNTGAGSYVNYAFSVPRPYASAISTDYNLFDLHGNNTFATVTEYDARYGTQFQVKTFLQANDWQSYLGQDIHSLTGNPLFGTPAMGVDSLHMPPALTYIESPAFANGLWLGTYSQKYDFDGDQRLTSTLTPSIGADEWDGFQYTNDLAVQTIIQPKGFSTTSDTVLVTTENPLWMTAVVKNMGSQTLFNRSVTATLQVALSGGAYNTIYSSTSAPMSLAVGQSQNVSFQGPTLTQAQATNGVFLLTISAPNDQVNTNNVQTLTFRVLLKQNAVLVCYNGASGVGSPGLMNRDSVTQALTRLGMSFDLMDRNAPDGLAATTAIDYTPWWTIIWCEGTPTIAPVNGQPVGQGGLSFKEEDELHTYLLAGQGYAKKSLVMAGQNIAYYAGFVMPNDNGVHVSDSNFLQTYMHTQLVVTPGGYVATDPVSGTYASPSSGSIIGQQPIFWKYPENIVSASPDVIKPSLSTPLVGSVVNGWAYSYATHPLTPSDSGAGTTYYDNLKNTIFYGFDWSNPVQTAPRDTVQNGLTSGVTRIISGALAFIVSHNGTILPVEFVTANGNRINGNSAALNWSVADQDNIASYGIEQKQADASWLNAGSAVVMENNPPYSFNVGGLDASQSYTYRIAAIDKDGAKTYSNEIQIGLPDDASIGFSLGQNYPNPSNGMTDVQYTLPEASTVTIRVLDVTGKEVYTAMTNETKDAGTQTQQLDLSNLASGTYVYQLIATGADGQTVTLSKKLTLEKQ